MPRETDTYARAYDCCDQIFTELGRFPTIDLIRERIGVNSPVTIKKAMNEWTRHFAERHFDKLNRPDIPVALTHAMEQAWKLAVLEAEKAYLEKEKAYIEAADAMQAELDASRQDYGQLSAQWEATRGDLINRQNECAILAGEAEAKTATIAALEQALAEGNHTLARQESLMAEERQHWERQQEQNQLWLLRRIDEEKTLAEERWREKSERQRLQIAALTEAEASLRRTCLDLRQELAKLKTQIQETEKKGRHKFKLTGRK